MPQFKKKLLFQSVTFSVAIGALIIGTVYFGRTISRASEEVVKNRQELLNRSTALDTLASLTHQYNSKGKKYLNVLYGLVPKRDDLFTLGQEFQSLATQTNLDFSFQIDEDIEPSGDSFGARKFRIILTGEADKIIKFIRTVQQFRYLTSIDGFVLSNVELNKSQVTLRGRVSFR